MGTISKWSSNYKKFILMLVIFTALFMSGCSKQTDNKQTDNKKELNEIAYTDLFTKKLAASIIEFEYKNYRYVVLREYHGGMLILSKEEIPNKP